MIPLFYHLPMDRLWQCKLMLVHTLNHSWQQSLSTSPSPDLLYANEIFPHTPWTFYGNEVMYTIDTLYYVTLHTPFLDPLTYHHCIVIKWTLLTIFGPPYILSLQCHIMAPSTVIGPPYILSLQCHIMDPLYRF